MTAELQHLADGYRARTADELDTILRDLGDLSGSEVEERALGPGHAWIEQLEQEGRAVRIVLADRGERWISVEHYPRYRDAFAVSVEPAPRLLDGAGQSPMAPDTARMAVLRHLLRVHGPLTRESILARYDLDYGWLNESLSRLAEQGAVFRGTLTPGSTAEEWCDRTILERLHGETLSLLRRQVQAVELPDYADYLTRWQSSP